MELVQSLQEEIAKRDIEIEQLQTTLRRKKFATHESALMQELQVEPLEKDMERMTRRRQKAVEETSDMITEAEKAVAIYEHTKAVTEEERLAITAKHEEDQRIAFEQHAATKVLLADQRRERLAMLHEDMMTAEVRYSEREKVLEESFKKRHANVQADAALLRHDTETITVSVAE